MIANQLIRIETSMDFFTIRHRLPRAPLRPVDRYFDSHLGHLGWRTLDFQGTAVMNYADAVTERHPDAAMIVPPRSTATLSASAGTAPTRRDQNIQDIAEHGRMGWQKSSGYHVRAKIEAPIGRYKHMIG